MKIKHRILLYFSTTVILLTGVFLVLIYWLFAEYREESFQQLQKEKAQYTVKLWTEFREMSRDLALLMDELTIHDFYDEKMLVYNEDKNLVFSSIDDLTIFTSGKILSQLSPEHRWVETKEGDYDVIGLYTTSSGKGYYAVSKALDESGYSKLNFLRNVLFAIFAAMSIIVFMVSRLLAEKITLPIARLAEKLTFYDLEKGELAPVEQKTSSPEVQHLTSKFNELLARTREAFTFQKHTIQHISHELKTPVAVLVSELERIRTETGDPQTATELDRQITQSRELGNIIDVLLEVSKIEAGRTVEKENLRIDEMVFDLIDRIHIIQPDFHFHAHYTAENPDASDLTVSANAALIRQVFLNLLANCTNYSTGDSAVVVFDNDTPDWLQIKISNPGPPIEEEEEKFLFSIFFRGKNSKGRQGFGLGLALSKKILEILHGEIRYIYTPDKVNEFVVSLPLAPVSSESQVSSFSA